MKVLMFGWEFPPFITGGLGTACYGLSHSLSRLVSKATFVLPKVKNGMHEGSLRLIGANQVPAHQGETSTFIGVDLPEIETITIDALLGPYFTSEEYTMQLEAARREERERCGGEGGSVVELSGDYGPNLFAEVSRYARVAGAVASMDDHDVIHAHDWMTFLAGVEAKRRIGRPLVVHVHALEFDRSGDNINRRVYEIERFGMRQADRIIAVSQRTKNLIVEHYGIDPSKIHVVYNGISARSSATSAATKRLDGKLVVFLGRITMQKGPDYFLEAAYLVAQKVPDVRFVMAGGGDLLPQIILRMAELRLVDRFHFTGFVDERKREDLLAIADLFVMTSVSEPFGLTPVEALQHNLPVIVTKQSGVSEVLQHAIKVDFWDVRRIADAIIKVLTEKSLAQQMVTGGQQDLSCFDWDHSAQQIMSIYQEIV